MDVPALRDVGNINKKLRNPQDTSVLEPGAPTSTPADAKNNKGSQYETGSGKPAGAWGGENSGK